MRDTSRQANSNARRASLLAIVFVVLTIGLAWVVLGQEPEPTPTPTMLAELTTPASPSWLDSATTPLVNFLSRHPLAFLVLALAVLTTNGLRVAWPTRAERPRIVAFLLGVLDPVAGNFWALVRWAASKGGFKPETPVYPTGSGNLPEPSPPPPEKEK